MKVTWDLEHQEGGTDEEPCCTLAQAHCRDDDGVLVSHVLFARRHRDQKILVAVMKILAIDQAGGEAVGTFTSHLVMDQKAAEDVIEWLDFHEGQTLQ